MATGWPELPDPPAPEVFTGPDGRPHPMTFRVWRCPTGILAEARESDSSGRGGYHVEVLSGHDTDVDTLVRTLRGKIAEQIGRLYLERAQDGREWTLSGDTVAGRLTYVGDSPPYDVVVDGRTLSWEEFGRALGPFEGWQFQLTLGDRVDEAGPGADVIRLFTRELLQPLVSIEDFDDDDEDDFLLAEEEVQEEQFALGLLRQALPDSVGEAAPVALLHQAAEAIRDGVRRGAWPHAQLAAAAGWGGTAPRRDDERCCVEAAGAFIGMHEDPGLDPLEVATILTMQNADWVGAVIGLVRAGPGRRVRPPDLVALINTFPEVESRIGPEDAALLEAGFESVLHGWAAAGVLDDDRRLTALGVWVLPRALAWAWNADFDDLNPF